MTNHFHVINVENRKIVNVNRKCELEREEVIDDPSDNSDLSENNLVNDSNCEIIGEIEIDEFKLEVIDEEDNVMVELPTQVTDNQISDIIKSETSESQETVASTSHNLQFVDCGETIKEELKEEVKEENQRDPLSLSNAGDETVIYKEFI